MPYEADPWHGFVIAPIFVTAPVFVIAGLTRNPVVVWHWIPDRVRDDRLDNRDDKLDGWDDKSDDSDDRLDDRDDKAEGRGTFAEPATAAPVLR